MLLNLLIILLSMLSLLMAFVLMDKALFIAYFIREYANNKRRCRIWYGSTSILDIMKISNKQYRGL